MDYLAYDPAGDRIWVPAGPTGRVDVIDARTGQVRSVGGFDTAQVTGRDGKPRTIGPSAAAVGDGLVYVGNRAGSQLCTVDARTLERVGCLTLPSSPDGVVWVAPTREVWVTTPRDGAITILDAKDGRHPRIAGRLELAHPEGYVVDEARGLLYTNQEEEDLTVAIDVRKRSVVATWKSGCGAEGPRGLALDAARRQLVVACAAGSLRVLDAGHDGALLGALEVGAGVDNIDYLPATHRVYAAAGRAGTLTVAELGVAGGLTRLWTAPAAEGGRVVVVDARGGAWVADSKGGRLVVFR
jgi:DNA-binding beta-propeller fold protein YncE